MNKRINELANQAHLVADATYARAPDSVWEREYNKKFVELIVRECIDIAYREGDNVAYLASYFGVER